MIWITSLPRPRRLPGFPPSVLMALGAKVDGAAIPGAAARVAFRDTAAMAVTAGIGHLVGQVV